MKTLQQLPVRFGHSPWVKLTLSVGPAPAREAILIRVVRIQEETLKYRFRAL